MIQDEKSALESIYDKLFDEKEKNMVWQLKFKIDHLLVHSPSEMKKMEEAKRKEAELEARRKFQEKNTKKKRKEKCWNYKKGKCKYGVRCLYSHDTDDENEKEKVKSEKSEKEEDPNWFYLEIRFPEGSLYPYEPPLIFLKTSCDDIPKSLCLRLTRRLILEAIELSKDGIPSVYTLAELLQADGDIENFIKTDKFKFLDAQKSLFHIDEDETEDNVAEENLATHYAKGSTGREASFKGTPEQVMKENLNIVRKFLDKQSNKYYLDMLKGRQQLPAWTKMSEIIECIESARVVVISGETGCGKSTQVPQFILDNWLLQSSKEKGKKMSHVEIVCTQPRRLSAIGVAQRVADERAEKIGNTVGYSIRLENKISSSTRLTFCTTGILLRRLQSDPLLNSVSHIIVDEVHERSEESDFLLFILRELLYIRKDLKIILMSATLNAKLFSDYFGGVPVLEIPGRTFPVEQLFLEDILDRIQFVLEPDSQYCRRLKKGDEELLMQEMEYSDIKAANAQPAKSIKDENLKMDAMFARYRFLFLKNIIFVFFSNLLFLANIPRRPVKHST
jgi:ATP-dependent RNA helicase DHX57